MSLDANIILAGRAPQFDDPLTVQNRQATLSALMGRQQMQQFELEGAQRQRADEQTLADLYRSAGTDPQALMQGMAQQGLGARIPGFQEQQAKLGKATSENQAAQYKFQKDVLADTSAGLQSLLSDPQLTTDKAVAFLATRARLMPDQAQRLAQEAARLPSDPGMLRQLLLQKALEAQSAEKRLDLILGKTEMQDQGGQRQAFNTNQLTGQVTTGQAFAKTATPEALMTDARTRSEGAANRGNTMAIAKLGDERARDRLAWEQTGGAGTGSDPTQVALTKQFGKAEPGRRWKADGTLEPIPGGSADQKTEMRRVGGEAVDSVIAELRDKYNLLDSAGGITNPDNRALANLPAALSSSGLGQATGRMLGTQNQSARNSIAQARPILLQAIMKATGMSAKQMDSNAELKLYLSTATDPTLDVKANREALDRLEKLFGSGASGAPSPDGVPPDIAAILKKHGGK